MSMCLQSANLADRYRILDQSRMTEGRLQCLVEVLLKAVKKRMIANSSWRIRPRGTRRAKRMLKGHEEVVGSSKKHIARGAEAQE